MPKQSKGAAHGDLSRVPPMLTVRCDYCASKLAMPKSRVFRCSMCRRPLLLVPGYAAGESGAETVNLCLGMVLLAFGLFIPVAPLSLFGPAPYCGFGRAAIVVLVMPLLATGALVESLLAITTRMKKTYHGMLRGSSAVVYGVVGTLVVVAGLVSAYYGAYHVALQRHWLPWVS